MDMMLFCSLRRWTGAGLPAARSWRTSATRCWSTPWTAFSRTATSLSWPSARSATPVGFRQHSPPPPPQPPLQFRIVPLEQRQHPPCGRAPRKCRHSTQLSRSLNFDCFCFERKRISIFCRFSFGRPFQRRLGYEISATVRLR